MHGDSRAGIHGSRNTKLFHKFTSHCNSLNTISEFQNVNGEVVSSFQDKEEAGALISRRYLRTASLSNK
jgi:hypothetical protein